MFKQFVKDVFGENPYLEPAEFVKILSKTENSESIPEEALGPAKYFSSSYLRFQMYNQVTKCDIRTINWKKLE
jgi:hypothetical protein